jgi:16S rRNA G966 N2-methylase RsmD
MFGQPTPARHFDPFPDGGGYPIGFIEWAMKIMGCDDSNKILHLCSGSVRTGITMDIRKEVAPNIVADSRHTPLVGECFDFILIDPPYSQEWAKNLYDTEEYYPTPKSLLAEACRVLVPNGKVGLLHFQVPMVAP